MMLRIFRLFIIGLSGFYFQYFLQLDAFADVDSAPNVSSNLYQKITEKIDLIYLGIFDGPSVTNPSVYMVDEGGSINPDSPVVMTSYLFGGYKMSNDITVGGLVTSGLFPAGNPTFKFYDPALRISDRHFIHTDHFNVFADLRWFIPITEESKSRSFISGLQSFQMSTYQIGKSPWSITGYSSIRVNFFGKEGNGSDFILYLAPALNYDISQKVSVSWFSGFTASHVYNTPWSLTVSEMYTGPGLSWDITPTLNFSPALTFPPTSPSLKSLSFLAFVVARIF